MGRTGLVVLQVLGGVSLLAYPFMMMVCIMSAPKANVIRAIPRLLPLLYPVVWIALWIVSWNVMRRGSVSLAYWLSVIPVALSMIAAVVIILTLPKPRY